MTPAGGRGLVAGKFLPPHAGHHHIIDAALTSCEAVDVVVCDLPGQVPDARTRAAWLAAIHPRAHIHVVDDICGWHEPEPCPTECSPRWAHHLRAAGLGPWSEVFGSEPYVTTFAAALDAAPVLVDPARRRHAVSGTDVRSDLPGHWHHLHPVVRAGLTQRVVVLGAESTGTTTLSKALARRLSAPWIREYGRDLSESRAHQAGSIEAVRWTSADFDHVADQQEALEQIAIRAWVDDAETSRPGELGPLAVCDTDVLATAIWHRRYCGTPAPHLVERALTRPPLVYILTSPDGVAFEQDGLRDGEALRGPMTGWFRDALEDQPTPWTEVTGTELAREEAALAAIRLAVASSGPRFRTR